MSSDPKSNPFEPGLPRPDDPDAIDGKSNDRERERNLGFLPFFFPRERERESPWDLLSFCLEKKFRGYFTLRVCRV